MGLERLSLNRRLNRRTRGMVFGFVYSRFLWADKRGRAICFSLQRDVGFTLFVRTLFRKHRIQRFLCFQYRVLLIYPIEQILIVFLTEIIVRIRNDPFGAFSRRSRRLVFPCADWGFTMILEALPVIIQLMKALRLIRRLDFRCRPPW